MSEPALQAPEVPSRPAGIRFEKVSRVYPARRGRGVVTALEDISLDIHAGEIFGVVGESGSGKSTLLRLVNALERPTSGIVQVDGVDLATLTVPQQRAQRRRIGMVFQQFNLLANLDVHANVALPLSLGERARGEQRRRREERITQLLQFVRMDARANQHPSQLSGGERQRVAIARALTTRPEILLCDEPTSALDGHHTEEVMGILSRVRTELGTTILLVSHELDVIKGICDRAAVLEGGRLTALVDVAPPDAREAFDSYAERAQRFLGPHTPAAEAPAAPEGEG